MKNDRRQFTILSKCSFLVNNNQINLFQDSVSQTRLSEIQIAMTIHHGGNCSFFIEENGFEGKVGIK